MRERIANVASWIAIAVAVGLAIAVSVPSEPAEAQSFRPGGGGGGGDCESSDVCQLTGGTDCTFLAGAGPQSVTNANLPLTSQGTGDITIVTGGNDVTMGSADGSIDIAITTRQAATGGMIKIGTAAALNGTTNSFLMAGSTSNTSFDDATFCIADQIDAAGSLTGLLACMYGTAVWRFIPFGALALSTPTDATTNPLNAGTACRMSSAGGVSAWTPAEGLAIDGEVICCTNTGANTITMTAAAGVYEAPAGGAVVAQWGRVCFEYVTDRWVQE